MAAMPTGEGYIATRDGQKYNFSYFSGPSMDAPTNRSNARCVAKGDNIPIWDIARDFMRSEHKEHVDYEKIYTETGQLWVSGKILASSAGSDRQCYALCLEIVYDVTLFPEYPSIAARGTISSGRAPLGVHISTSIGSFSSPYADMDFTNYIVKSAGDNPNYYPFTRSQMYTSQSMCGMFDNFQTMDGGGTMAIRWPVALAPYVLNAESEYPDYGFMVFLEHKVDSNTSTYVSFSSITAGDENVGTKIMLSSGNGLYDYIGNILDLKSGYEFDDNPYKPAPNNGGGGGGSYNGDSDTILPDGVPTVSALSTGFINMWDVPTHHIQDIHSILISDGFADIYERLKINPIDFILSLQLVPYVPIQGEAAEITIAGFNTEVNGRPVTSQYLDVSCGTIQLSEFWGSYRDYAPFTSISIYLPFVGIQSLDINEAMASSITVDYRIDVLSGECVATVTIANERGLQGAVYHYNGNCNMSVPVTGQDHSAELGKWMNIGGKIVGAGVSLLTGGAIGLGAVADIGMDIMQPAKVQVERAGSISGNAGVMGNYTPFIIVKRPSPSIAADFNHYKGWVSNVTRKLGSLSGYTEVAYLKEDNIPCTKEELEIIRQLLKDGVYL